MFIVLIWSKSDPSNRHWVKREDFAAANAVASEYAKDNTYAADVYQAEQVF